MQRRRPLPDRPVRSAGAPITDPESEQEPEPEPEQFAPEFELGTREVFAVEHPAIIQNLDNGIKTFGRDQPFERIINCTEPEECIPLYIRFRDPTCAPILSQSTSTQNIVLKITVPKRTGRRRKKGSRDPFTYDGAPTNETHAPNSQDVDMQDREASLPLEDDFPPEPVLCSHSRLDTNLWKKLRDNADKYTCEVVGEIKQTHRFRGLADFHQATSYGPFFSKFQEKVLPGDVQKMREFKFDPSRGWKPGEEIILPANLTPLPLPFNWHWQQNPHVNQVVDPLTGETRLVNVSKLVRLQVEYLPHYMETIPQKAHREPPDDEELLEIIAKLDELYQERPIWTRRALINRVNHTLTEATLHLIRLALPYIGYRFKDGPFRDAIIKFGLDPRKDPKYRMYQTIYFQLAERDVKDPGAPWNGIRQSTTSKKLKKPNDKLSHFFNGRDVAIDGKIWQMCDVTDPLLARLIKEAPIRETFEQKNDGWFCNGTLAKIRAIMKVKIVALHTERETKDEDFKKALEMPDIIPERQQKQIWIPVPDIKLTKEEMEKLRADGKDFTVMSGMVKKKRAYVGRLRQSRRNLDDAPEWSPGPRGLPGLQQKKGSNIATENQKLGSAEAESADESRRPSTAESIDSRLLADQVEGVNLGADGDVDMGEYGEFDEDEMGDSDMYSDLSQGSDWDENSEMEGFSRAYGDRVHSPDGEAREGEGERADGASEAESISMVQYQDQDSPSQLAQSIEGPDKN